MTMAARIRKRKTTDRDFLVTLKSISTGQVVPVGVFYAESSGEAIDLAKKMYSGCFAGMETNDWMAQASAVAQRVVAQ
jgi:hypothetical protein